jgi:putative PIN family toxin of toxin-antitoxin system
VKVFLDTNVLVSALATRGLCADVLRQVLAEHELLVGERVLREVRRVLRVKLRVPQPAVDEIEQFLRTQTVVAATGTQALVKVRDADDARILAEAVAGGADVPVTGDRDLLDLADRSPLRIVTPRGFWELLRAGPTEK